MNLLFWRKDKQKKPAPVEERDKQINRKNFRDFLVRAVGLVSRPLMTRREFAYPEYDLEEIRAAYLSDSYIKMAVMKYSYLIFKAGYSIKSENQEAAEYIRQRFRMMSFATGTPMDVLFQEVADDLIKYSNAFLVKARDDNKMPGLRATPVFSTKPVMGYFRIDPATIRVKRNKHGRITKYLQEVDGQEQEFSPLNMVHFYMDKEANDVFGTPRIVAALEDVKLLRKIEGNIMSLIYRFAIPLYQVVVGLAEKGFQATDPEIDEARREIEKMSMDGVLVTNERTEIKSVGAEGQALDATGYLDYFEKRVFTALGVSEAQMGRGGAKQDADSMEAQIHDTVKHVQRIMSIFIENYIINELLLEGGFNPILNDDDNVRYEFEEISLETKVKLENHQLYKFQSNIATFDETRKKLGMKEEADEERLYANMIEKQLAIEQIEAKAENETHAGNGKNTSASPSGAVSSGNNPSNQHGSRGGPKLKEATRDAEIHKKTYLDIYKKYEQLRNDIVKNSADIDRIMPDMKEEILKDISFYIRQAAQEGMIRASREINKGAPDVLPGEEIDTTVLEQRAQAKIENLFSDIHDRVDRDGGTYNGAVFDTFEYRVRYLLEHIVPKAYWYGYVKTCAANGISEVTIEFNGSEDQLYYSETVKTRNFRLDDIPAFHPFCSCQVKVGEQD